MGTCVKCYWAFECILFDGFHFFFIEQSSNGQRYCGHCWVCIVPWVHEFNWWRERNSLCVNKQWQTHQKQVGLSQHPYIQEKQKRIYDPSSGLLPLYIATEYEYYLWEAGTKPSLPFAITL